MSNSSLVTYTRLSKNCTKPRNHKIDTITIHCYAGQVTAQQGCDYFATTPREASANYVVGKDGSIGLSVDEANRSWASSNRTNDHRAVTIEVASDATHPYAVTAKAYAALLDLVTDICKRNGIKKLLWKGDKSLVGKVGQQNMTVHRWFANKACPGDYLYNLHDEIAAEVNRRLGAAAPAAPVTKPVKEHKPLVPDSAKCGPYKPYARTWTVTASALNMRLGASTTKGVIKTLKRGETVTCYGFYTQHDATIWLYVKDKTGAVGYVSKKYLK